LHEVAVLRQTATNFQQQRSCLLRMSL